MLIQSTFEDQCTPHEGLLCFCGLNLTTAHDCELQPRRYVLRAPHMLQQIMTSLPLQAELNNANGPELELDMLSQDMLRKYITYAKANCRPKLQNADYEKITQVSRQDAVCEAKTNCSPSCRPHANSSCEQQLDVSSAKSAAAPSCRTQTIKMQVNSRL